MKPSMSSSAPSSRQTEVIWQPSIPQGTIHSNGCRSLLTLIAKPCVVIPRLMWTPIEPILRAAPGAGSALGAGPAVQTPVRPSISWASTPSSPSDAIITRSIRAT